MRLLLHLAGDVPSMAQAEALAVFEGAGVPLTVLRSEATFLDGHMEAFHEGVRPLVKRLGLTHSVSSHLFDGTPKAWTDGAVDCCVPTGLSFAVRAVAVDNATPWRTPDVEREVGAILAPGRRVDLTRPSLLVRAYLLKDRIYVGQQVWESDPADMRSRHVDARPFSTPVSLDPRLARGLVNLSRVQPGQTLYDPFCGTGGVLLEGAAVGAKVLGSDLDPEMVEGSRKNLAHYGVTDAHVFQADAGDAPVRLHDLGVRHVDAVVTDLPYGRSASTGREAIERVYARGLETIARVLRPNGFAVVGMPGPLPPLPSGLTFLESHTVRAHRSLTRHFHVVRRV